MGKFARAVLGRSDLPSKCLVFGGVYVAARANVVKRKFDAWTRPKGAFIKCAYAKKEGKEHLICFNVYGAATMLELLHTLKDGKAQSIFFVGSMGSQGLEIGTVVVPDEVVNQAGIVSLDSSDITVKVNPDSVTKIERALRTQGVPYVKGKIASVPSVLHQVKRVKQFLSRNKQILGVELELSTFHHFGRKLGLKTHGILYVHDNPKHDLISGPRAVWEVRMNALSDATNVTRDVI